MRNILFYSLLFFVMNLIQNVYGNDDLIFYNSFEDSCFKPEVASNKRVVKPPQANKIKVTAGIKGKAVILGDNGKIKTWLGFPVRNNIKLESGTVSMWIKPLDWDGTIKGFGFFFKAGNPDNSGFMFYKYTGPGFMRFLTGRRDLKLKKTDLLWLTQRFNKWRKNEWHHIAFSWRKGGKTFIGKEGRIRFYIDGNPGPSKICDEKYYPTNLSSMFYLGAHERWGKKQIGFTAYDELKIYSRELTPKEVKILYLSNKQTARANSTFSASPLSSSPVIDGKISDNEWSHASSYNIFFNRQGLYASMLRRPEVKLGYDNKNIYIAMREYLGKHSPKTTVNKHDGPVYLDDSYEIFLSTKHGSHDYRHFIINSNGALYDGIGMNNKWNSHVKVKSCVKDGWWTVETAIPVADIALSSLEPGKQLNFNICRTYTSKKGKSFFAISDQRGSFHNPKRFASLLLLKDKQTIKINMANPFKQNAIEVSYVAPEGFSLDNDITLNGKKIKKISEKFAENKNVNQKLELKYSAGFQQYSWKTTLKNRAGIAVYQQQTVINLSPQILVSSYMNPVNGKVAFKFYPATSTVNDKLKNSELTLEFVKDNQILKKIHLSFKRTILLNKYQLPDQSCLVKYSFCSNDGKILFKANYNYYHIAFDKWKNYTGGLDDNVVPAPWTPVKYQNETLTCWNRQYVFNKYALPQKIMVNGTNILRSEGIRLDATIDGKPIVISNFMFKPVDVYKGKIILKGSKIFSGVAVEARLEFEFDGYCVTEFKIERGSAQISNLCLKFPFTKETSQLKFVPFLNEKPVQKNYVGKIDDHFSVRFRPGIWVGNDQYGLTWFAESDQFWYPKSKDSAIELVKNNKGEATLLFNLIAKASVRLPQVLKYKFGFQATPIKPFPAPRDWLSYSFVAAPNNRIYITGWGNLQDSNHQGFPGVGGCKNGKKYMLKSLTNAKKLQSGKNRYHTKLLAIRYLTPTMCADTLPEFKAFKKYWTVMPYDIWGTDAPNTVPFFRVSPESQSWSNFYCYKFNEYFKRSTENGMYQDFGHPILDSNSFHGSGYVKNGKRYPTYSIYKYHELQKRLYTIAKKYETPERPIFFIGHSGGSYCLPHGNFWQMVVDGEYLGGVVGKKQGYLDFLTTDRMRAEFSGRQFGVIFNFIPVRGGYLPKENNTVYTEEMMAALVPHGILWGWHAFTNWNVQRKVLGAYKLLGYKGIEKFLPYWKNSAYVTVSDPQVHCSILLKKNKALLNLGNFSKLQKNVVIKVNLKQLGFNSKVTLNNAVSGKTIAIDKSGNIKLNIGPKNFAILLLKNYKTKSSSKISK